MFNCVFRTHKTLDMFYILTQHKYTQTFKENNKSLVHVQYLCVYNANLRNVEPAGAFRGHHDTDQLIQIVVSCSTVSQYGAL